MSYKLNRLSPVSISNTPVVVFSGSAYTKIFYRLYWPATATNNLLVMSLPVGSATPTQNDLIVGADFNLSSGQTVQDDVREVDIWMCHAGTSGSVSVIPKEGYA